MTRVRKLLVFVVMLLFAVVGISCDRNENHPVTEPTIYKSVETIVIKDTEVDGYNYKSLFTIKVGDNEVPVIDDYINATAVKKEKGIYFVTCSYEGKTEKIAVEVQKTETTITLKEDKVSISVHEVEGYDFNSYFEVKVDGKEVAITSEMVKSTVSSKVGNYKYIVSLNGVSKTLDVEVYAPREVKVKALKTSVDIKINALSSFDFTSLFSITVNDKQVQVLEEYLDLKSLKEEAGEYEIYCEYENIKASVTIVIVDIVCVITCKVQEVTINQDVVDSYDFKSLFTIKVDGEDVKVTDEMIKTNLEAKLGEYTYTVSYMNASKEIKIKVLSDHIIEIIKSYNDIEIHENEISSFDYTSLFSLYVDGKAVKVEMSMIDTSELSNAEVGKIYKVSLVYSSGNTKETGEINVKILGENEIIITPKNLIIYPNSDIIDLKNLFEIKDGDTEVNVLDEYITGEINYNEIGLNEITLTYKNKEAKATVEVKRGVVIDYAKSDTIKIIKGTNQESYSFESDFIVRINGILFKNIPSKWIDTSNVDFNTVGTYECKLEVPYNDKKVSLSGVKFTYFDKTIKYVVLENEVSITLKNDKISLPKGTTEYDPFKNLQVKINGRNQTLTTNPNYVDSITCYAKLISEPIDFNDSGLQTVSIEVYGNGVNADPIIVSFDLVIESNVKLNATDKTIFSGETIYAKDLFSLTEDDEPIEIKNEYITGKIDSFTPGVYYVTISYRGLTKTAKVVVLNGDILGTYDTKFTTIPELEEEEDDSDNPYGDYGEYDVYTLSETSDSTNKVKLLDKLIINSLDDIKVNGKQAELIGAVDENTLIIKYGTTNYTLYYKNGIVVLDPDNSIKLGFSDNKRPLLYAKESMWDITNYVIINYGQNHVLQGVVTTYSIDIFELTSKTDNRSMWYGLKVHLINKTSSDTVYNVTWGEVEFASNFKMETGNISSFTFNETKYNFQMLTDTQGKTNITLVTDKTYANKIYSGQIDGKDAELRFDPHEGFEIYINNVKYMAISNYDFSKQLYGGLDKDNDIVLIHGYDENIYSYKFFINYEEGTFELAERDLYYGKYETDGMYIFFDGYGKGLVNFNTKSYYRTELSYNVNGRNIEVIFENTTPGFAYGSKMILSIESLLNVVTIRDAYVSDLKGKILTNCIISDGAIVTLKSFKVGKASDKIARDELYSYIEITTKDGVLTDEQKRNVINTSCIRFNTPGFYEFTITLPVNGEDVVSYYAIEVLEEIYKDSDIINNYGQGIINNSYSLRMDKYGQIFIVINGVEYAGTFTINENGFNGKAMNDSDQSINIRGEIIADGIILVRCTGYVTFNDLFTTGESRVIGSEKLYLREIKVNNTLTYILSESLSQIGKVVSLESVNDIDPAINGSIVKFLYNNKETFVRLENWGNTKTGISLADGYRGEYQLEGQSNIFVDGFGVVTIDGKNYEYILNSNTITVIIDNIIKVYQLNTTSHEYKNVDFTFDNSSLEGKKLSQTYNFICGSYSYEATTVFEFRANGVVKVTSSSESHDDYELGCTEDQYEAPFAKKDGSYGKFSIDGNIVRITVESYVFEFTVTNVLTANEIKCISTSVSNDAHGYFAVGTIFTKVQ